MNSLENKTFLRRKIKLNHRILERNFHTPTLFSFFLFLFFRCLDICRALARMFSLRIKKSLSRNRDRYERTECARTINV